MSITVAARISLGAWERLFKRIACERTPRRTAFSNLHTVQFPYFHALEDPAGKDGIYCRRIEVCALVAMAFLRTVGRMDGTGRFSSARLVDRPGSYLSHPHVGRQLGLWLGDRSPGLFTG